MALPLRLVAENLACERGGRLVFSNVNFALAAGELMALRGPNGTGKSSLLRLLAGLNVAAAGSINIENGSADASVAEQAHYVGHAEAIKPALTSRENLKFWARFLGGAAVDLPLNDFNLEALAEDQALLLSAGQKRRLALSRLKVVSRQIWLLDEPTVGLDVASLANLKNVIEAHLETGGMIIAATHAELGVKATQTLELGKIT